MSRIRCIKPGFFENERIAELSFPARLLYIGLWCWADKEGRMKDRPRVIKNQILGLDDCDVNALLNELADAGFIVRYEVGEGRYLTIPGFKEHQQVREREQPSTLPNPPASGQSTATVRDKDGTSTATVRDKDGKEGKVREGKGRDDVANNNAGYPKASSSSSDNPLFVATNIHDDDPDGQTYRQTAAILEVNGQYPVEKAVFAVLEQNRKRGFSNEALLFEATQWASKLGKERKTPAARAASFREWMDTAFERGPPGNGKSLQDRVYKSTAEDRKILNDRYQKQFGRPAYPEDA